MTSTTEDLEKRFSEFAIEDSPYWLSQFKKASKGSQLLKREQYTTHQKSQQFIREDINKVNSRSDADLFWNLIFDLLDADDDGSIDVEEYLYGVKLEQETTAEEKLKVLFELYHGGDHKKGVSQSQIVKLLNRCTELLKTFFTEEYEDESDELEGDLRIEKIMKHDKDKDGFLLREEFLESLGSSFFLDCCLDKLGVHEPDLPISAEQLKQIQSIQQSATSLSMEELTAQLKEFLYENPSGLISYEDWLTKQSSLPPMPKKDDEKLWKHLFELFDTNHDGKIDFKEFLTAMSVIQYGTPEQKLEWTFSMYDADGNGTLSREEVVSMMKSIDLMYLYLNESPQSKMTPNQRAERIFQQMDKNGDGVISKSEFMKGAKKDKVLLKALRLATADESST